MVNKITEDNVGPEFYDLVQGVLQGLDTATVTLETTKLWADMQLLAITGHQPNMTQDAEGQKLESSMQYEYDESEQAFVSQPEVRMGQDILSYSD